MQSNEQRLKQIFCEHLGVEESFLVDGASIVDDLCADSLDEVELVMAVEEEFGIEIIDDDAEKIQTFGDALKYVNDHVRT